MTSEHWKYHTDDEGKYWWKPQPPNHLIVWRNPKDKKYYVIKYTGPGKGTILNHNQYTPIAGPFEIIKPAKLSYLILRNVS
jgi:hypothetical protein